MLGRQGFTRLAMIALLATLVVGCGVTPVQIGPWSARTGVAGLDLVESTSQAATWRRPGWSYSDIDTLVIEMPRLEIATTQLERDAPADLERLRRDLRATLVRALSPEFEVVDRARPDGTARLTVIVRQLGVGRGDSTLPAGAGPGLPVDYRATELEIAYADAAIGRVEGVMLDRRPLPTVIRSDGVMERWTEIAEVDADIAERVRARLETVRALER